MGPRRIRRECLAIASRNKASLHAIKHIHEM